MKTKLILIALFLLVYSCKFYPQQYSFGPLLNNYRTTLSKYGSNSVSSEGLLSPTQLTKVGKVGATYYRALYQWDIPDNLIPDNAIIDSVRITYLYSDISGAYDLAAQFYRIPSDISIQNPNWTDIWNMFTDENKITEKSDLPPHKIGSIPSPSVWPYDDMPKLCTAVKQSLQENKFVLGIKSGAETVSDDRYFYINTGYVEMRIYYQLPHQLVTVTQILSNGAEYGNVGRYEGSSFIDRITGTTYSLEVGSTEYFRADTNKATVADEKFNNWNDQEKVINHNAFQIDNTTQSIVSRFNLVGTATIKNALEGISSVTGDTVKFQDPWLRDDNSDSKGLKNRGAGAIWHPYPSPFVQSITNPRFKGVLLNQAANTTNPNYYSAQAKQTFNVFLPQTGKTHSFYFVDWTSSNASVPNPRSLETPVVFTAGNSEVLANYKGTQLSNTQTAFSNSSQRKFIRTPDGNLHVVYESMGLVWYERSSDGGSTWVLMNNGKPLSTQPSKSPSIDYCGSSTDGTIGIVFHEKSPNVWECYGKIKYYPVFYTSGVYGSSSLQDIEYLYDEDYDSFDASPVIAFGSTSPYFLVVWKGIDGLMTKYFNGNNSNLIQPLSPASMLGSITDAISEHPFLVNNRLGNTGFHLAWDENTSSSAGDIRYCKLSAGTTVDVVSGSYNSNVSSGSGFVKNSMPTMIAALDNTVRISWLGTSSYGRKADAFRGMFSDGSWNPRFWSFGSNVASQCMNLGSDGYYLLFSDYTSGSYKNQFADSRTLSNIYTLNTTGKDIQLNNSAGDNSRTMYAMSFSSQGSLPYTFTRSTNSIGSYYGLYKENSIETSGRMVVLKKDSLAEFYFSLQEISLDGKPVKFMEVSDSIRIKDISSLNKYMITEPFTLTDNSKFLFNLNYGVTDSSKGLRALGKEGNISYSVDLLDEEGKVLQSLNLITFSKALFFKNKQSSFQVNTKGIGNKTVRMRLNTNVNFNAECFLVDSHSLPDENGSMYKKAETEKIDYMGEKVVKEYAISRNYPNPFNPSTVIDYQVPKTSKVTLKVFDMLGKEVTTLVNEVKEVGRYSVKFDASELPSGTYIYEIRANDFVKSGKMMLLK
jgi:hypothetical protein